MVDHKLLLPLYNNPKRPMQMRVDRHWMKLAGYHFSVSHISGEKNPCDYGSRAGCLQVPSGGGLRQHELGEDGAGDTETVTI